MLARRSLLTDVRLLSARRGLSQLELLTCLAIVALLAVISLPALLSVREMARQNQCRDHLRRLTAGLIQYHDHFYVLPPAAHWDVHASASLALHKSHSIDRITKDNWGLLILPQIGEGELAAAFDQSLPIGARANEDVRSRSVTVMNCPTDTYNTSENAYIFHLAGSLADPVSFARGNYGINGGTHNFELAEPSTTSPLGDYAHLIINDDPRQYQLWGNGVAGINKSFRLEEFANGLSTLVALEELRAGLAPQDPRGVWALGQIGGSITWAHGAGSDAYRPNHQWQRADDILGCPELHQTLGQERLAREKMPCCDYINQNQQATSRSLHPQGVFVSFLDGSVRMIGNDIDPSLWHVLHSRETPATVLKGLFEQKPPQVRDHPNLDQVAEDAVKKQPEADPGSQGDIVNSLGMRFVLVPSGEYLMGIPDDGMHTSAPDEAPPHLVTLTKLFLIGTHEVTVGQYRHVVGGHGEADNEADQAMPITGITWEEAQRFCQLLTDTPSEREAGRSYRLPSEAEWEYACRAGSSTPYSWSPVRRENDHSGEAAGITPALPLLPVGSFPPNSWGLYDMRGNAWEWCSDWFARDYYSSSPDTDPEGPTQGYLKVVRGGDWRFVGERCLIDYPHMPAWKSNPVVGFRMVCELNSSGEAARGTKAP